MNACSYESSDQTLLDMSALAVLEVFLHVRYAQKSRVLNHILIPHLGNALKLFLTETCSSQKK